MPGTFSRAVIVSDKSGDNRAGCERRDVPRRELDVRFFSGRVRDKIGIIIAIWSMSEGCSLKCPLAFRRYFARGRYPCTCSLRRVNRESKRWFMRVGLT